MNNPFKFASLLLAVAVMTSPVYAALIITDGDITADQYTYSLSFADMNSSTKFDNDVFSQSNVTVFQEGSGSGQRNFVKADAGQTAASLLYKFDFSTTSYRPEFVDFTTSLFAVDNASNTYLMEAEYSTDGLNWNTLRVINTNTTSGNQTSFGTNSIDLTALAELPDAI